MNCRWIWKLEVKCQYGGHPSSETGSSFISAVDWGISSKFGMQIDFRLLKRVYLIKSRISLEESLLQSFFVWKLSAQSFEASVGLTNRAKMIGTPCTWNFGSKWPRWSEIADFRSLFARSDWAVTPSEKSWINVNRKSTTRFSMSPR